MTALLEPSAPGPDPHEQVPVPGAPTVGFEPAELSGPWVFVLHDSGRQRRMRLVEARALYVSLDTALNAERDNRAKDLLVAAACARDGHLPGELIETLGVGEARRCGRCGTEYVLEDGTQVEVDEARS